MLPGSREGWQGWRSCGSVSAQELASGRPPEDTWAAALGELPQFFWQGQKGRKGCLPVPVCRVAHLLATVAELTWDDIPKPPTSQTGEGVLLGRVGEWHRGRPFSEGEQWVWIAVFPQTPGPSQFLDLSPKHDLTLPPGKRVSLLHRSLHSCSFSDTGRACSHEAGEAYCQHSFCILIFDCRRKILSAIQGVQRAVSRRGGVYSPRGLWRQVIQKHVYREV